ncbi:MAG: endolytic transglycosylase MltG [Candidatus Berkelbacteria bacterium]|nr:endolytic transglycosylase MltG [Candidatus Berkelbacteria bacterium]
MEEKPKINLVGKVIRRIIFIFFSFVILFVIIAGGVLYWFSRSVNSALQFSSPIMIQVQSGDTADSIATKLISNQINLNRRVFQYGARLYLKDVNLGFYEITPGQSIKSILTEINNGETKTVKVTFPEGWRMEQMAIRLDKNGIIDYSDFVAKAKDYEGKLFPDTYLFAPKMTADEIIAKMTVDYSVRTEELNVTKQDLIVASIVERESANDTDRALIAGIYLNRIKAGMKLQSDPTVEYGRDANALAKLSEADQKAYSFWSPAKTVEFASVISPFNTYLNSSLPPAPICDPGIKSIEATLNPQKSNYYYFLYGKDGKIHPAKNQAEHEANIAKYM